MDSGGSFGFKKNELEIYLSEDIIMDEGDSFDVLRWWKHNSERFPVLSLMARDVLAVPSSTVASESAFSTGGRVLDSFRSSLSPKIVEALICTSDWLRMANKPICLEKTVDDLERFEKVNLNSIKVLFYFNLRSPVKIKLKIFLFLRVVRVTFTMHQLCNFYFISKYFIA